LHFIRFNSHTSVYSYKTAIHLPLRKRKPASRLLCGRLTCCTRGRLLQYPSFPHWFWS